MHFTLDGVDYRLGFRYKVEPIEEHQMVRGGDHVVELKHTWMKHTSEAVLWQKVEGPGPNDSPTEEPPREFHWEQIAVAQSVCSKLDHFDRGKARLITLGRLMKGVRPAHAPDLPVKQLPARQGGLSPRMADAVMLAFANRFPPMPQVMEVQS